MKYYYLCYNVDQQRHIKLSNHIIARILKIDYGKTNLTVEIPKKIFYKNVIIL